MSEPFEAQDELKLRPPKSRMARLTRRYKPRIEAKDMVMTTKRWMIAVGVVVAAGLLAWIWMGRGSNGDDAGGRGAASADSAADAGVPVAAVAGVERHNVGSTLTIAGEFKPFQDTRRWRDTSGRFMWTWATA